MGAAPGIIVFIEVHHFYQIGTETAGIVQIVFISGETAITAIVIVEAAAFGAHPQIMLPVFHDAAHYIVAKAQRALVILYGLKWRIVRISAVHSAKISAYPKGTVCIFQHTINRILAQAFRVGGFMLVRMNGFCLRVDDT